MADKTQTMELISAVSEGMTAEDMMLSSLQAMIAAEITMKRHALGMSQKDLADAMGVSQTLVSKWESGETNYTLKTLVQIASKLGIGMCLPFETEHPKLYTSTQSNIVSFPGFQAWKTNSSSPPSDTYTLFAGEELMEN